MMASKKIASTTTIKEVTGKPDGVKVKFGSFDLTTGQAEKLMDLAKEKEEVFIPGNPHPVRMAKDSPALHILQRARDEAHRFAISYHHKLRRKAFVSSTLDSIAGIGRKRRKALLRRFGSVEAIKRASPEEISQTEGITLVLARKVKKELAEQ